MIRAYLIFTVVFLTLAGCATPTPQVITTEVTRIVVQTQPVEVTRLVEVTKIVEHTAAPIVITATAEPTAVPTSAPGPAAPTPPALNAESVIAAFQAAGLEAEQSRPLTKDDYGLAPLVGSGLRFIIPSLCADCGGRLFVIQDAEERARLKSFYEEMGKASALAFSWVFERAPFIVQLNGDLPEAQARKYEATLQTIP